MKRLVLALLLFWVVDLHAAQVITIPQGTPTIFGPVSISALQRRSDIKFVATSNTFTTMSITFEYSPNNGTNWIWYGTSIFPGGQALPTPLGSAKKLPDGATATHIRAIVTVLGASVSIAQAPVVRTK